MTTFKQHPFRIYIFEVLSTFLLHAACSIKDTTPITTICTIVVLMYTFKYSYFNPAVVVGTVAIGKISAKEALVRVSGQISASVFYHLTGLTKPETKNCSTVFYDEVIYSFVFNFIIFATITDICIKSSNDDKKLKSDVQIDKIEDNKIRKGLSPIPIACAVVLITKFSNDQAILNPIFILTNAMGKKSISEAALNLALQFIPSFIGSILSGLAWVLQYE